MSIADLRAELARAVKVTADHLAHLAAVWRELEARGEDMSALKAGLWTYMPAIASGALLPELVVKYAGYATLLTRLARLPVEDQRKLLADDTLPVVNFEGGEWIEKRKRVTELRASRAWPGAARSHCDARRPAPARACGGRERPVDPGRPGHAEGARSAHRSARTQASPRRHAADQPANAGLLD